MRTKTLVPGLKNTQKIRIKVDEFMMYCTVQDAYRNIASVKHAMALGSALTKLGMDQLLPKKDGQKITGFGSNEHGFDVQVDLVDN